VLEVRDFAGQRKGVAMNKLFCVAVAGLSLVGTATAQLSKCVDAAGRITYSDTRCAATATSETVIKRDARPTWSPPPTSRAQEVAENPHISELTNKIARYISAGDIEHAASLAVTTEQFQMIETAKRDKQARLSAERAEKRAAEPVVCKTTGVSSGVAQNVGYVGLYNGSSYSKTVCNK
jgi:hypothetical protein